MKDLLKKVTDGDLQSVDIPFTPISSIETHLEELDLDTENTNCDTNGWQLDFWYYYVHKITRIKYVLSGSFHYGEFKFSIA